MPHAVTEEKKLNHIYTQNKSLMTQKIFSFYYNISLFIYFPRADGSDGKESACNVGDPGSIPGSGRSPGEGNGDPLQCSDLENSMDRGAWWATVDGVAKSQTLLRDYIFTRDKRI